MFTVIDCFDVPVPIVFSGLAYDGTSLWFNVEDFTQAVPVDPETGMPGAPIPVSGLVHAVQNGDFWTHCGCGGSHEASRWPIDGGLIVDMVDTDSDLANEITIRGIAYDSVGNALYLAGDDNQLLRVDSDAEPDVLLGVNTIDSLGNLGAITWDGSSVWAIVSSNPQTIIRVDVNSGIVTASYPVPDATVTWQGIAAVGPQFFLIGSKSNEGVLCQVTP